MRHALRTVVALCVLALSAGCATQNTPAGELAETSSSANEVYVAFAGGGWRAHTAHAAWTIGLLDNDPAKAQLSLNQAFANVSMIASNSGGSWYNTMLSYSPDFRNKIQATNAATAYLADANGYFQLEKNKIQGLPKPTECSIWEAWPPVYFTCILGEGVGAPLDWRAIVDGIVFYPFAMSTKLENTTLGGGGQDWSSQKSLLLAATMLTQKPVLAGSLAGDKYYYSSSGLGALNVIPVTFSSTPPAQATPAFFPGLSQPFTLSYTYNGLFSPPVYPVKIEPVGVRSGQIKVISAASGSSAAAAFIASHAIDENNAEFLKDIPLTDWAIAYEGLSLPVYFNMPVRASRNITRWNAPPSSDAKTNAYRQYVQIADGGPLDNSGVIQAVSYHQQKHSTKTPFSIVAFDNVQGTTTPSEGARTGAPVGVDIAALFGFGFTDLGNGKEGFCTDGSTTSNGFCITVVDKNVSPAVSPQIFDRNNIFVSASWAYSVPQKGLLIYTKYDVTTVDSALMGVMSGWTGTLHAFTALWPDADTAPWETSAHGKLGDISWAAYAEMFNAIQTGVKQHGGLKHLRSAFGLP